MKQLAKSGDRAVDLAGAFDASPNPYVLLTPDFPIAGADRACLDVTSRTREAIIGHPLFAAFDSGPDEEAPENVRHDLAGEVKLDYASDGFTADFLIPLDRGINS